MNKVNSVFKNCRKAVSVVLCFLLLVERSVTYSYSQEAESSPAPTPTETPSETSTENLSDVTNNVDSGTETGENSIEFTSPSPTPSPSENPLTEAGEEPSASETPTPTEIPLGVIEEPAPSSSPTPVSEIETGDSVSVVNVDNEVNTNIVNSEFINHTLNIYLSDGVGDVDLNLLAQNAVAKVYGEDQNLGETVSVTAYSIDNFAYVENNIEAEADTGGNEIDSSGEGEISTGNAYSSTSVLNKVNTNVVNSQIHIITINIFGSLTGNIILPSSGGLSQEGCCQASIVSENVAIVVNNVSGQANTGQNQIVSSGGEAEIETGNAKVAVNVYNLVNTNIVNSYFNYFEINNMGEWSGSFLGWNENQAPPQNQSCDGCTGDLSLGNSAEVVNNVSSSANTGENSINGGGAKIKTGNAYAGISIVNLVNTNIINSVGFIGFINIFGRLLGDVGGSQYFSESIEIPEETEDVTEVQASQESQEPSQKESGGTLEVSHSHNVGTHVLPGDTVTFFAKVKNPGTGTVYGTILKIELVKNGVSYGGVSFNLGDIKAQKGVKLTTGLVLSEDAVGGEYTAHVSVVGTVGPDDHKISATSESKFLMLASTPGVIGTTLASDNPPTPPEVLGQTVSGGNAFDIQKALRIYLYFLGFYLLAKAYQRREDLVIPAATKFRTILLRLNSLLT